VEAQELRIEGDKPSAQPLWRLLSEDQKRGVQLGTRAISLHATSYLHSGDFMSRWAQILVAAGIAVGLRVSGLTASNLVTLSAGATPLVYVIPIGAIIVAALVAHVRMSPELRSKLSLQLKFVPDNIKFWTGRGIVAK